MAAEQDSRAAVKEGGALQGGRAVPKEDGARRTAPEEDGAQGGQRPRRTAPKEGGGRGLCAARGGSRLSGAAQHQRAPEEARFFEPKF